MKCNHLCFRNVFSKNHILVKRRIIYFLELLVVISLVYLIFVYLSTCYGFFCNAGLFDIQIEPKDLIASFGGLLTVLIACLTYSSKRAQDNLQILIKYNERYTQSYELQKAVKYLRRKSDDMNRVGNGLPPRTDVQPINLYTNERELYMRFFEELQLLIDDDVLPQDKVHILFGYYAGELYRFQIHHSFVDDFFEKDWDLFRKFAREEYAATYLTKTGKKALQRSVTKGLEHRFLQNEVQNYKNKIW